MTEKNFIESREEMESILRQETLGFLGLCGNGQPYVVPMTYAYADGRILFHCAWKGKKLDLLRANPNVCFTVGNQFDAAVRHPQGGQCAANQDSVICFGTARILEDETERWEALNAFNRAIVPGAEAISLKDASSCCAVEIAVEEMTGRRQRDGGSRAYWRHSFAVRNPGGENV